MNSLLTSGRLWRMCLKELRETLRDRRTVTTLLLMPILVYPLLSIALHRLILTSSGPAADRPVRIGVGSDAEQRALIGMLDAGRKFLKSDTYQAIRIQRPSADTVQQDNKEIPPDNKENETERSENELSQFTLLTPKADTKSKAIAPVGINESDDSDRLLDQSLRHAEIDLIVRVRRHMLMNSSESTTPRYRLDVRYYDGDPKSEQAMMQLRRFIQIIDDHEAAELRRTARGSEIASVELHASAASIKPASTNTLASVIPLVLVLMTITGAVYPAIDLTAGERERGTMEALIASPVPRFALLLSKYAAVVAVAILTAIANLSAMWITLFSSGIGKALLGKQGFSLVAVAQILPLLIIFACFFSAILLALCSFAKSFKEAQAYLIPVMLLSLAPGLISLMPGIEFTPTMAIVPLVNIVLLARDILTGSVSTVSAFIAASATVLYAAAVLSIAARLFGNDGSAQSGQTTWTEWLRRPRVMRSMPSVDQLAMYLACFYPFFFVITSFAGSVEALTITQRLWINAVVLAIGFLLVPLMFARLRNLDVKTTFRLSTGRGWFLVSLFGAFMISLASWMGGWELYVIAKQLGWGTLRDDQITMAQSLKHQFQAVPLAILLTTTALIPAICEEFFFRGFALSALHRLDASRRILFSALLFGAFHVVTGSVMTPERFLPTFYIGLFLGWVAVRTNSLWPGIVLHAAHNSLFYIIVHFEKEIMEAGWGVHEQEHLPLAWLGAGTIVVGMGVLLIWWNTRSKGANPDAIGIG